MSQTVEWGSLVANIFQRKSSGPRSAERVQKVGGDKQKGLFNKTIQPIVESLKKDVSRLLR